MSHNKETMLEAKNLYIRGWSQNKISEYFKGKPTTKMVCLWREKYGWDAERQAYLKDLENQLREGAIQSKVEMVEMCQLIRKKLTENLKKDAVDVKPRDGTEATKTELLIRGEATARVENIHSVLDVIADEYQPDYDDGEAEAEG
jgi:hypothetical protein